MNPTVTELIQKRLTETYPSLSEEQQRVLYGIWQEWPKQGKLTQRDLATMALGLGHHEIHEEHLPSKKNETTLRKVRQIIRDLRVTHNLPILSDKTGYWLPHTIAECEEYLRRIEAMARAQAAAWHETYRAMERTVGVRSEFFDKQRILEI